ncbi:hypothetical protein [uncultured Bacteroides sp.]|uniref:hypothetical protein n=1 Tax=uncultured Bacteroides sp. TaxID=162156 RepID=UPI002592E8E9|nr:hypothetical protein [uncultured Bacteroides sp.]
MAAISTSDRRKWLIMRHDFLMNLYNNRQSRSSFYPHVTPLSFKGTDFIRIFYHL